MKNRLAIITAVIFCASFFPTAGMYAQGLKIGFFDFQELLKNSKRAKAEHDRLKNLISKKRASLEKQAENLKQLQENLKKHGPLLKEEKRAAKVKQIRIKEMDFQEAQQQAEADLKNETREVQEAMGKEIEKIIKGIRSKGKYHFILKADALLSAADALDITQQVVKIYDAGKPAN
jgi:Skp family chaperone for outer membrane proteins